MEPRLVNSQRREHVSQCQYPPWDKIGKDFGQSPPVGQTFGDDGNDIFTRCLSTGNDLGTLSSKTGVSFDSSLVHLVEGEKSQKFMELENFINKLL